MAPPADPVDRRQQGAPPTEPGMGRGPGEHGDRAESGTATGAGHPSTGTIAGAKAIARRRVLNARRRRSEQERAAAAAALAYAVMARLADAAPGPVAAYVALGTEPGTAPVIDAVLRSGREVLLPRQRRDGGLDYVPFAGWDQMRAGRHGISEPVGSAVPPGVLGAAALILVPALAVDRTGRRLGRGGGAYDRALALLRTTLPGGLPPVCAVVFDEELLDSVPVAAHDEPVDEVLTPSAHRRLTPRRGRPPRE